MPTITLTSKDDYTVGIKTDQIDCFISALPGSTSDGSRIFFLSGRELDVIESIHKIESLISNAERGFERAVRKER